MQGAIKPKAILTGSTGGLGSRLLPRLSDSYDVVVLTRKNLPQEKNGNALNLWLSQTLGPLLSPSEKITIVHTATDYGRNTDSKDNQPWINQVLPFTLLQWMSRRAAGGIFLNADTSLPPTVSDYAASKAQFRKLASALAQNSKNSCVIHLCLEHLYGPGLGDHNFVTAMVRQLLRGDSEIKLTLGEQKRDFIYIDDAIDAFITVLKSPLASQAPFTEIPLGSGKPITIRNLVTKIKELIPQSPTQLLFGAVPYRAHELMESTVDLTKAHQLGWEPKISLDRGLKLTVQAALESERSD